MIKKDYQVRIEEDGEEEQVEVFTSLASAQTYYKECVAVSYDNVVNSPIYIELILVLSQHCTDPPYVTEKETRTT